MGKSRLKMRKTITVAFIIGLLGLVSVQFTNCDSYSDSSLFNSFSSHCLNEPDGEECYDSDSSLLELRINSATDYFIPSGVAQVNVAGDCNEGGFSSNLVIWEVWYSNSMRLSSQTTNPIRSGTCQNGQFSLLVDIPTNLVVSGVRQTHTLYVEIIGIDSEQKQHQNSILARKSVYLIPQ